MIVPIKRATAGVALTAALMMFLSTNLPLTASASESSHPKNTPSSASGAVDAGSEHLVRSEAEDTPASYFDTLREKEGGITTVDPTDPSITLTTWAEEGIYMTSHEPSDSAKSAAAAAAWECVVEIPTMKLVVGGLQWGAHMRCSGDYAPSWIVGRVEDTCKDDGCFLWQLKAGPYRSPSSRDYLTDKNISLISTCTTSETRKLSTLVEQFRQGVRITTWDAPDQVMNCRIKV